MGKIYYIMGKSASGKDTIYNKLFEECPEIKGITLYTTRPKRDDETDGRQYYFVSEEELSELIRKEKLLRKESTTLYMAYGAMLRLMTGKLILITGIMLL